MIEEENYNFFKTDKEIEEQKILIKARKRFFVGLVVLFSVLYTFCSIDTSQKPVDMKEIKITISTK